MQWRRFWNLALLCDEFSSATVLHLNETNFIRAVP
ncbi:hypothetical protein QFZ84_004309 [Pseudomonas fluorescens]